MFNPLARVGPPWAGNQLVNCVTELVTACEDRAQELGYEDLARPLGCYDPGHEDIFDQALQATVTGLRASIRQALQSSWGPEQVQGSPADNLMMFDGGDEDPTFSEAPTCVASLGGLQGGHVGRESRGYCDIGPHAEHLFCRGRADSACCRPPARG